MSFPETSLDQVNKIPYRGFQIPGEAPMIVISRGSIDVNHLLMDQIESPQNPVLVDLSTVNPKLVYAHDKPTPEYWKHLKNELSAGPTDPIGAAHMFRRIISHKYPPEEGFFHPDRYPDEVAIMPKIAAWDFLKLQNDQASVLTNDSSGKGHLPISRALGVTNRAFLLEHLIVGSDTETPEKLEKAILRRKNGDYPPLEDFVTTSKFIPNRGMVTLLQDLYTQDVNLTLNTGISRDVRDGFVQYIVPLVADILDPDVAAIMNIDPNVMSSSYTKPAGVGVLSTLKLASGTDLSPEKDLNTRVRVFYFDNDYLNCALVAEFFGMRTYCKANSREDALKQPHLEDLGYPKESFGEVVIDPKGELIKEHVAARSLEEVMKNVPNPGRTFDL